MHIILYRTKLCPRCFMARKYLLELTRNTPGVQIEERELLTSPGQTLREGIFMIPAIRVGDQTLSGVILSRKAIADFLHQNGLKQVTPL